MSVTAEMMLDPSVVDKIKTEAQRNIDREKLAVKHRIEISFGDQWIVVADNLPSKDAALWAISTWKQTYGVINDRFYRIRPCDEIPY